MAFPVINPILQFFDNSGNVLSGGLLFVYSPGTTTKKTTYSDENLSVQNANPIVLDSAGRCTIFLADGEEYKFVLAPSTDTDPPTSAIRTVDEVKSPTAVTQSTVGAALYPRTAAEIAAGVTPTNYYYEPGHVYRYGTNTVPGTTNMTTALQAALDANNVIRLPGETMAFTNLTIPVGRLIEGEGPRKSVLRQTTGTTGNAMTFSDAASSDISEGGFQFSNFAMHVATGSHGLYMGAINGSMFISDNFRLVSRHAESLGSPPYSTTTNQRGIYVQNDGTGAIYFNTHRNLEIRSFDIAIDADDTINEWTIHGWILDCRVAIRLTDCSTWNMNGVTVESGVSAARVLQTFGACSNLTWIGGRWELTRPTSEGGGCYGIEGDGTTTGQNWRFASINVIINGDGSAIPGLKWTGTVVNDFVFEGYDASPLPFVIIPNLVTMRLPNLLTLGGTSLGNALITLGRNSGGAACTIGHDGTHLEIKAGNSVEFFTGATLPAATLDDTTTAGNTRLLVFDVDNNQIERVTVGAADSGGAGFKLLRIPN